MSKMRSPNYPAIGLGEAISTARQLWERERRTAVDLNTIATAWGYSSVSGRVRSKLGALRKYGLLEDVPSGTRISELGMRIVHGLPDTDDYKAALREAALCPELFKELQESFLDASDQAIKSYLILKRGFADLGAGEATKAFRETIQVANLEPEPYNPPSDKAPEGGFMVAPRAERTIAHRQEPVSILAPETAMAFRWLIGNGVVAEVRLLGKDIRPGHLDMLRQQLELTKQALEMDKETNH